MYSQVNVVHSKFWFLSLQGHLSLDLIYVKLYSINEHFSFIWYICLQNSIILLHVLVAHSSFIIEKYPTARRWHLLIHWLTFRLFLDWIIKNTTAEIFMYKSFHGHKFPFILWKYLRMKFDLLILVILMLVK